MISVLNHLLPLNGSSRVFYVLISLTVLFSCRTVKPEPDPIVVPIVIDDNQDPVDALDTITSPIDIVDPVDADTIGTVLPKKAYKIALLLPFSLDEYQPEFQDVEMTNFKRATEIALEFYQGFEMAINNMEQNELDAEIFVFDTENSPSKLRSILNGSSFPKADLIIGPIFNNNLRIAAEYSKRHKIPLISPLSSSTDITADNPYYYSANGTSESHYEALAQHIKKFYPADTVHVIHNSTSKSREVIQTLKKINQTILMDDPIVYSEIPMTTESNTFDLKSEFDSLSNHVVLIPSYEEVFTNYALNQLAQIKTYYPSVVFGMPTWKKFKNVNYDYLEWLQVHLTQSYWVNEHNIDVVNTTSNFSMRYRMAPSTYAYQGYDLAHFVISYLAEKENTPVRNKEQFFVVDEIHSGLQTSFQFLPRASDGKDGIDFWDNKYMHILKFENYTYNKVD
ncbi:MAG: amino acid ABC transporter substrate-binding protein [Bacteroidetes bacterium]|nr:amino acid ABC transporter substrate-binding protein [Bacteroidota bacterium]